MKNEKTQFTLEEENALLIMFYASETDEPEWLPKTSPDAEEKEDIFTASKKLEAQGLCKLSGEEREDHFEGPQFNCILTQEGKNAAYTIWSNNRNRTP